MAIRRRWLLSVMLLGAMPALGFAADAPIPTVADFETADVKTMPTMVAIILKSLPGEDKVRDRNTAATALTKAFQETKGLGIDSKRAEARLNAAILISNLKTLSSDFALIGMLKSPDPAVRYYGAKGLAPLAALEKLAAQGQIPMNVVGKLADASKVEKSGVVQQEIVKTLIVYEASDALIDALESLAAQMQTAIPESATLQTAALAQNVIAGKIATANDATKKKAATVAVNLAGFAVQQYRANEKILLEGGKPVPADYQDGTAKLIDAAGKAAGAAIGKTLKLGATTIDEMELNINSTFGTPGGAGKLPGIPAPGVIKPGQ